MKRITDMVDEEVDHAASEDMKSEDGDVIDCVDIYKQPAFDHPLIKHLQYAFVSESGSTYYGAHASFNVWNPKTEANEFSLSQIWVLSEVTTLNTIEAGWMVYPGRYLDNQTRFFIYWTSDNYQSTGCYDLGCPGFVQTNHKFAIGSTITPVSTYNGKTFDISILIFKDNNSGNWWLQLQDVVLGYWPGSIFTGLAESSTTVEWGGEIINSRSAQHHTTTQMGSGHFPFERYGKSSFFYNLKVIDNSNTQQDPASLQPYVTDSACYDLHVEENRNTDLGTYFYYGGPGYSAECP
ncbi:uncharacterized protein LOC114283553 [Camellia sinensis]|uniref:uncharacterized protein LOC114283553 n=1 Tax=Camellia sinensis TaxID=4442 RepID=UPI001036E455|nr:uncharacterized protein LOC114283553 [Camellia sinensis]